MYGTLEPETGPVFETGIAFDTCFLNCRWHESHSSVTAPPRLAVLRGVLFEEETSIRRENGGKVVHKWGV